MGVTPDRASYVSDAWAGPPDCLPGRLPELGTSRASFPVGQQSRRYTGDPLAVIQEPAAIFRKHLHVPGDPLLIDGDDIRNGLGAGNFAGKLGNQTCLLHRASNLLTPDLFKRTDEFPLYFHQRCQALRSNLEWVARLCRFGLSRIPACLWLRHSRYSQSHSRFRTPHALQDHTAGPFAFSV